MDIFIIDYYANHGRSFIHNAGASYKLLFVALVIASVMITGNLYLLLSIYLTLMALAIWTRLPALKIALLSGYPAIFALLYVIAIWTGSYLDAAVIMLKALCSSLAMVTVIVTTPYPKIFDSIKPFLPNIIGEALFLTYRAIFILIRLVNNLLIALRLRGGTKPGQYYTNTKNFASGLGLLLVKGLEISEKMHGVMQVRGYSGRISSKKSHTGITIDDVGILITGTLILGVVLGFRYITGFNNYPMSVLALSGLFLIVTLGLANKTTTDRARS